MEVYLYPADKNPSLHYPKKGIYRIDSDTNIDDIALQITMAINKK